MSPARGADPTSAPARRRAPRASPRSPAPCAETCAATSWFEPGGLDVEQLDVGRGHDESLHRREHVSHLMLAAPDHRDTDRSSLPLILVVDFGDRNRKAVAQPVDDRADRGALGLERTALRCVEIETSGG